MFSQSYIFNFCIYFKSFSLLVHVYTCIYIFFNRNSDHENVIPACELTLKNLGLEYLDLYLIHWPNPLRKGSQVKALTDEDKKDYTAEGIGATWKVKDC